jgi:hypothetical protein
MDTVFLAQQSSAFVVGIDLSGDPVCGDAAVFLPALAAARASGLKVF